MKPSSLGHCIRFVRSLFRFAYEETYLPNNPSLKLCEPKLDKRIPKFLMEEDDIHLKISCQSLRERGLLEFLYSTGCHIGEVEKLNIEDLNWENLLGYINCPVINKPYISDDLFKEITENPKSGGYQSVLGLAVSKHARNQGIAKMLIEKMEQLVEENEREGITLTCKQELVSFTKNLDLLAMAYQNQHMGE